MQADCEISQERKTAFSHTLEYLRNHLDTILKTTFSIHTKSLCLSRLLMSQLPLFFALPNIEATSYVGGGDMGELDHGETKGGHILIELI